MCIERSIWWGAICLIAGVLVCAALVGCAPTPLIPSKPPAQPTVPVKPAILPGKAYVIVGDHFVNAATSDAVADWTKWIPELSLSFGDACPRGAACIFAYRHTRDEIGAACFGETRAIGCTLRLPFLSDSSEIWIAYDIPADEEAWVWRHEIGHAMALAHTAAGTMMAPSYDVASHTVTPADVAQWRLVRSY